MNLNHVEIILIIAVCILAISNLISIAVMYKMVLPKNKKSKCPNKYNCGDCIHSYEHWDGIKFRGFGCRLDVTDNTPIVLWDSNNKIN